MADNFAFTPGVGSTGAADDIDGVLFPRVKVAIGANNTNDGDISATNPMPVTGTVTANLSATDNTVLDNIDTDLTTVIGHVDGIETTLTTIDGKITACNTGAIAGSVTANAGTNLNTSALALEAGGNLASIKTNTDKIPSQGQALAAVSLPVVLPEAQITALTPPAAITGFATATKQLPDGHSVALSATDNAVLDAIAADGDAIQTVLGTIDSDTGAIKTAVEVIDNAISGSEMQVDVVAALPAGTNAIGKLAANSGVDIGDVDILSIAAGTNAIGNVGIVPRTSGGLSMFRSIDIDESEEDVKTSAGQVFGYYIFNAAATTHYVKFYNATAANVTVGTTTPVLTLPIPAGAAANLMSETGIAFSTAISVAATTGVADNDTGAPAGNAVVINVFYA